MSRAEYCAYVVLSLALLAMIIFHTKPITGFWERIFFVGGMAIWMVWTGSLVLNGRAGREVKHERESLTGEDAEVR
jgi:hypothetical protein